MEEKNLLFLLYGFTVIVIAYFVQRSIANQKKTRNQNQTSIQKKHRAKNKTNTPKEPISDDQTVQFLFSIIGAGDKPPINTWYQKKSARNKNYCSYKENWGPDWKHAGDYPGESTVKVTGISHGNRAKDFLEIAQLDDFKMYLEKDPSNPINKNAEKIMVSGTLRGVLARKHIGYLPDNIANKYAGNEINISPKSVFLPTNKGLNLGIEAVLLVRSNRFLKKNSIA